MSLLLGLACGLCHGQPDPFETDDALAFLGAGMDGGQPDFTTPFENQIGRIEGWRISGRQLDGNGDLDWIIFYGDEYPYCPVEAELRVIAEDNFARNNLRVEIIGYPRDFILNPGAAPLVLQSCGEAPVGDSTVTLTSVPGEPSDFRTFYRLRSCSNSGPLNYRFEYRIIELGFCFAPSNIFGTVRDARNGRVVKGAYIYTDQNSVTFSGPADGEFQLLVFQDNAVILDFFAAGLESLGPVNIGPVSPSEFVEDVVLLGQPPGTVFFSGFE